MKPPNTPMANPVSVRMSEELLAAIRVEADADRRSVSDWIRLVVEDYLEFAKIARRGQQMTMDKKRPNSITDYCHPTGPAEAHLLIPEAVRSALKAWKRETLAKMDAAKAEHGDEMRTVQEWKEVYRMRGESE